MKQARYFFVVGTVAELIKIMPIMHEFSARSVPYEIISTGQNTLDSEDLFETANLPRPAIHLSKRHVKKSPIGLFAWFIATFASGFRVFRTTFGESKRDATIVVHGDTLSTLMGAVLGKLFRLRVAHVEAGLRSHNFLQPFPEELDRYFAAFFSDFHFAPSDAAVNNLNKRKGEKINTHFNTNIDSLAFAQSIQRKPALLNTLDGGPFWIFIMHRQENLLNKSLLHSVVALVRELSHNMKCVFVAHMPTVAALERENLMQSIYDEEGIILSGRLPYVEFMTLLEASEFIVTDGGGNQQECFYMGKPCLLLRNLTEGDEGLGRNVVVSKNNVDVIRAFAANYRKYVGDRIIPHVRPSKIIADTLLGG